MKSEIFALHLFKSSPRIQLLAADLLESGGSYDDTPLLIKWWRSQTINQLSEMLQCPSSQVFEKLAERFTRQIHGMHLPPLTLPHIQKLESSNARRALARALECRDQEVYEQLFDLYAILKTFYSIDPDIVKTLLLATINQDSPLPPIKTIIQLVVQLSPRITRHFLIGERDWGKFLDKEAWLRHSALAKLSSYAASLGYHPTEDSRLLAVALEASPRVTEDVSPLDTLAILHIRQRLSWISAQLREKAQELLESEFHPVDQEGRFLKEIRANLRFYEMNEPALAWRDLLEIPLAKPLHLEPTNMQKAYAALGPALIRGLILTGVSLPVTINPYWARDLDQTLSVRPLDDDQDMQFPTNQAQLLDRARSEYSHPHELQIIE